MNVRSDGMQMRVGAFIVVTMLGSGCMEAPLAREQRVTFGPASRALAAADYAPASTPPSAAPSVTPPNMGGRVAPPTSAGMTGGGAAGQAGGRSAGQAGSRVPPVAGSRPAVAGMGSTVPSEPPATGGAVEGVLTVKLTSVDLRGRYSPRNCGAVWVESSSGMFVKTLERWCGFRAYYLERWTKASGGWGGSGRPRGGAAPAMPNTADMMDAVSAATLRAHMAHESSWKLRDSKQMLVPDGDYKVVVEVSDGTGRSVEFPFTKGRAPVELKPADAAPLSSVSITFQPQASP